MAGTVNSGGFDMEAAVAQGMAAAGLGPGVQTNQVFVPLWKVRPKGHVAKANIGEFGDDLSTGSGGTYTSGKLKYLEGGATESDYSVTSDQAASSFMDMSDKDRAEFMKKAIASGLLTPSKDGVSQSDLFEAWKRAASAAAQYNADRDKSQWISPWEATDRLGVQGVAGAGGAYDPFKPHTTTSTRTRDFTKGGDAEAVTSSLEQIFQQEMGRAPSKKERSVYEQLVQKAYNANPEQSVTTAQTDASGNTTSNTVDKGGVDMTATLLDQIRDTPEADAYQAGSTFFQAAMQHLGAIA